jgi:chromo domain-containing protein 1
MTERTVTKQSRAALADDDISITSSQSEQYSSDQEFLVDRILAEKRETDGKLYFLILWAGYPEEKSTWEPKKNIQDRDILKAWKRRKKLEARGVKPAFNLASFTARVEEIAREKADRHRRRKAKRRRLGIPVSSSEPENDHHDDDSDSTEAMEVYEPPEDVPETTRRANLPARKPARDQHVGDVERSSGVAPAPRGRGSNQQDVESDSSDDANGLFVGDKKRAKQKALQSLREKRSTRKGTQASEKAERGQAVATIPLNVRSTIFID